MRRVLTVGTILVATVSAAAVPSAAQEGTPEIILDVPRPEECRVTPLTADALVSVLATPAAGTPEAAPPSTERDLPAGEPVDPATLTGVTETTRQFIACINAGDTFRSLAVVTEDFLRLQLGGVTPTQEQLSELETQLTTAAAASPVALEAANQGGLVAVRDPRRLPDGRVGAVVVVEAAGVDAPPDTAFFLFLERDGRWLIDEIVSVAGEASATPAA